MMKAHYRKINDRTLNSSTYHKKDGTNVRAKLKEETRKETDEAKENDMSIRDQLQAENPDAELLFMDEEEFDEAIFKVVEAVDPHTNQRTKVVAYLKSKVIAVNMGMGMTQDEAEEYFSFNQGCAYVGPNTPIYL